MRDIVWDSLDEEAKYRVWSEYVESTPRTRPLGYVAYCSLMETGTPPEGIEINHA